MFNIFHDHNRMYQTFCTFCWRHFTHIPSTEVIVFIEMSSGIEARLEEVETELPFDRSPR
jgi:hypothetical protein